MTPVVWSALTFAAPVTVAVAAVVMVVLRRRRRQQQLERFFEKGVLEPDTVIVIAGRFRIERLVQQGGMGVVYRARDRATGDPVAIKLLLRPREDGMSGERFARETRILAGLDHPRINRYVAHGTIASGDAYLVVQWLDGEDLKAVLTRGRLGLADSMRVLAGATEGLAAVHAQGIVHRDLKPGNLFLRGSSAADLLLLDFGVARRLEGDIQLTRTAAIVGTPHYMSPEQASGSADLVAATDVFALGCIFYECLTGKPAFGGDQMITVLARILFDTPEPVGSLRPSVPAPWAELLSRMLSKRPSQRPADARALLQELSALPQVMSEPGSGAAGDVVPGPLAMTSGDQVLVSVVLAMVRRPADGDSGDGGSAADVPSGFASVRTAMNRFGCVIEQLLDGSVLATVFPRPSATDQARIAARCALALRDLWPQAAIAVTTGPAPLDRSVRVGDAVDRAARLLQAAGPISGAGRAPFAIRLDSLTAGLLDARFATEVRDGAVVLFGENPDLDQSRLLLGKPTPCVGREVELGQLEGLMSTVVDEAIPRAAVVIGPPGIGKSRVRHELCRRLETRYPNSEIVVGFGDPLNAGSPYVIARDALRRLAGIGLGDEPAQSRALIVARVTRHVDAAHRRRVSEFLGELCGTPFPDEDSLPLRAARSDDRVMSEQIAAAFVDWLTAECAAHPVIILVEDVQWSDVLTVKLLETTLRDVKAGALLVIVFGRPEAEESFPRLLAEHRAFSLSLRPLGAKASETLVRGALGDDMASESVDRVVRLAGGNALFLEELIRAAAVGQARDVPETVLAMLQARLSRLPPEARLVLRAASVFGETFWRGSVKRVCDSWSAVQDTDRWLNELVGAELVERRRASRFSGEIEYAFRHQLVVEAARGLLTDLDRRLAHQAAGQWLEAVGEPDGVVLARHAEAGGKMGRAVTFYARAAEQSLGQNDFGEALARATRGIACGAAGEALGILRSVQASALYSTAKWMEAAEVGLSALPLLPAGDTWWCLTTEKLLQVLPNTGQLTRCQEMSDEMLQVSPLPEARQAFVRALYVQLLGHSFSGPRRRGLACLEVIDKVSAGSSDHDIVARGYSGLWRAIFHYIRGTDLCRALSLAEQAERDLSESQVMYRLSLACMIKSFIRWGLGDHEGGETAARRGLAVAREIHDGYHEATACWYLGLALSEQPDPSALEEAEHCARMVRESRVSPLYEGPLPRVITGRIAVARKDWVRAEAESRVAREGLLHAAPPWGFISAGDLLRALVNLGRGAEAAAVAREDLLSRDGCEGPMCTEVLLEVAAAEALCAGGDRRAAEDVLRVALRAISLRAANIADPTLRRSYLGRREENRRAFELEGMWLAGSSVEGGLPV
jgi:eukaryotic-like serine/threonine-protein kinase